MARPLGIVQLWQWDRSGTISSTCVSCSLLCDCCVGPAALTVSCGCIARCRSHRRAGSLSPAGVSTARVCAMLVGPAPHAPKLCAPATALVVVCARQTAVAAARLVSAVKTVRQILHARKASMDDRARRAGNVARCVSSPFIPVTLAHRSARCLPLLSPPPEVSRSRNLPLLRV